jgi:hypothetical protein
MDLSCRTCPKNHGETGNDKDYECDDLEDRGRIFEVTPPFIRQQEDTATEDQED